MKRILIALALALGTTAAFATPTLELSENEFCLFAAVLLVPGSLAASADARNKPAGPDEVPRFVTDRVELLFATSAGRTAGEVAGCPARDHASSIELLLIGKHEWPSPLLSWRCARGHDGA